ncbi:MAG: energy-coupling factor transporter transmembrane component T [Propionibacteriaceae bacterium]|nr:energy-coupling factor transporter transmembrane component T [Propionibacteriaceae bacterium]
MTATAVAPDCVLTRRGLRADPRSWILLVAVVNILVVGGGPFPVTVAAQVIVLALVATLRRPRLWWSSLAWFALTSGTYLVLPMLGSNGWLAAGAFTGFWLARFSTSIVLGICVLTVVRPGELIAALSQIRTPRWLTIPLAVMFRFLPVVRAEYKAVVDAMSLRGLHPGARMISQPLRTLEYVLVPLLTSCSRIADDLSASALVRGLGSPRRPTSIAGIGFGPGDALIWLAAAALIALRFAVAR